MVDFSERRTVNTNRPKKQGMARYFVLTALGGVLAGYGLGFISGWVMLKPSRQELNALRASAEKAAKPVPATTPPPQPPVTGPPDPNLSFYKTLPEGKAILGTGMNSPKPEIPALGPTVTKPPFSGPVPSAASPAVTAQPQPATRAAPTAVSPEQRDGGPREKPAVPPAVVKPSLPVPAPVQTPGDDQARKAPLKGNYVVQVASYQSRAEAEAVKVRLADAGLQAYIVESALRDRGTWYRVRVGRHLDQATAAELAVRAGKNAIVILE